MRVRTFVLVMALSAGLTGSAQAAQVYVVHGIPGHDVGAPAVLPVDVCLAGGDLVSDLTGVAIDAIAGPLELPAGRYDREIRVGGGMPCAGPLAVAGTVYLTLGESASVVAHLSEQGSPALTKFINDVRALGGRRTRLVVRHGAAIAPVSALLKCPRFADLATSRTAPKPPPSAVRPARIA